MSSSLTGGVFFGSRIMSASGPFSPSAFFDADHRAFQRDWLSTTGTRRWWSGLAVPVLDFLVPANCCEGFVTLARLEREESSPRK
jgi:hypothetical protein